MKRIVATLALGVSLVAAAATARAAEELALDRWPSARAHDVAALQNGARIFANYCLNCHSASLMRWNKLRDIGLTEAQIKDFLIFGNQKVGDLMTTAMDPKDAKAWLGKAPPDLSLITRARTSFEYSGTDYIYTLLRGYYRDASTATGWNNVAYPNVAMPNIFWEVQGPREATLTTVERVEGSSKLERTVRVYDVDGNVKVTKAELENGDPSSSYSFKATDEKGAAKVDGDVADLVAYLAWMTEPVAQTRVRIGTWALIFLAIFTVFAWRMNGAFWKRVK